MGDKHKAGKVFGATVMLSNLGFVCIAFNILANLKLI
jgi:hypothetical protein